MTKQITQTRIKIAKMEMVDGEPKAVQLPDEIVLGNWSLEKAQYQMKKKYGESVTVFSVEPFTTVYEMKVEDFMKVATPRNEK